jgi:hypothetical protein
LSCRDISVRLGCVRLDDVISKKSFGALADFSMWEIIGQKQTFLSETETKTQKGKETEFKQNASSIYSWTNE